VKLLVQPGNGITPLLAAIDNARKSVEILIFRSDRRELERALEKAVRRGVAVHALIADTNRGGEKNLRKLELRLLAAGVTVGRTNDDLVRYHAKMIIVDRSVLYLLAFNFTYLDIEHSRTFGLVIRERKLVQEAIRLFEADSRRQPYHPRVGSFVISPQNARPQLAAFIRRARKQLLVYNADISDPVMIRLLQERQSAGVDLRIVGSVSRQSEELAARRPALRLHTRTMVRDQSEVFIGSQGLREVELDARREVGLIFRDRAIAGTIVKTFEEDWSNGEQPVARTGEQADDTMPPASRVAKRVAKAVAKDLPAVTPALKEAMKEVIGDGATIEVDRKELEDTVRQVVKQAVKQAVRNVVENTVEGAVGDRVGETAGSPAARIQ
jgi:cardiolipin synthase A/B